MHIFVLYEGQELFEGNLNDRTPHGGESKDISNFAWRGGQERQTTGIWMWSEPFFRTPRGSSEQLAVLLMDTQGMFDNETSMALTAQIFGLSTFVSSFQVIVLKKSIKRSAIFVVTMLYYSILRNVLNVAKSIVVIIRTCYPARNIHYQVAT